MDKDLFSSVPLFSGLEDKDYQFLADHSKWIIVPKGKTAFRAGDIPRSLFVLRSGLVKLYRHREGSGKEEIVCLVNPGQHFCLAPLFAREKMHIDAMALSRAEIAVIPKGAIEELIGQSSTFARNVIQALAGKECGLCEQVCDMSLASPKERLAKYLLEQFERSGKPTMTLSIRRTDLAAHLGTVRESLSRHLSSLQKAGVITVQGKRIQLRDPKALSNIAVPQRSRGLKVM